ncbi:MAG: TenA family protein [Rhodobacteraceae bacterium]|nr:TenA family protein [Paracoccaceae bacterium]
MQHYGSDTFQALRRAEQEVWDAYTRHRFVEELGAGTLRRDVFLYYLKQDYVFLIHFARAWAMAVVKSDQVDEMRQAAATVHALLDVEMRLHIETCAAAGIAEQALAETTESLENLAYTRFVIDAGVAGDLLDLLTALMPCVLGYGEIGARLAASPPSTPEYAAWIATYGGEEYQELCADVGVMFERVAARRIGAAAASGRWAALRKTFRTACRLEAAFWPDPARHDQI